MVGGKRNDRTEFGEPPKAPVDFLIEALRLGFLRRVWYAGSPPSMHTTATGRVGQRYLTPFTLTGGFSLVVVMVLLCPIGALSK